MTVINTENLVLDKRERFEKLVSKIEYRSLADIAADHCYISLLALISNKVDFVIASDLNKAPLEIGKANIKEFGAQYENKIETRLGSGVSTIKDGEVESVIIAGIGGNLMLNLLQQEENKLKTFKQLILQPQNEEIEMKKYIHSIGYSIKEECYVCEKGMDYIILNCINEVEEKPYTEEEYVLGRHGNVDQETLEERNSLLRRRYNKMLRLKEKLDKVENKQDYEGAVEKYESTLEHIEIYKKFFKEV